MTFYKTVGSTLIHAQHRASCHCGRVILELDLPNGVENPRRCNCSICDRKGAITSSVPLANLRIVQGEEFLTEYQFNTKVAKHYFCNVCGIYTHHQRRSDPNVFAYNVACLEGVDTLEFESVPTSDGRHHIADRTST